MSLADKVIKNTFYFVIFQLLSFLFPLLLTPFIISKIGEVQFGIYALVLGFIGMFSLFDLSISSSFIVFISKYYVKKDFTNLNKYFNTGLFFYILFSLVIVLIGFVFTGPLLSLLKIPPELWETSVSVYYTGLLIFFISNAFTIFSSILISLQKMYITSLAGIFTGLLNLILTVIVLNSGYGLIGIMWVQLLTVTIINVLNFLYARASLPEMKFGLRHLEKNPVKEMTKFGAQMQISKLASFASEKYDEFLLAYFSILNNVTYFNIANRISRTGRLIPFQIIYQIAPVSSELNAKGDKEKLHELFLDTTKYLILLSIPVFVFLFIFSDLIITTWVGKGFELSSYVLRVLVIGQLINMTFSAPGNSIIPNMGIPKFQMREGLIYLGINILLSFFLIKFYGIMGAAIGNVLSTIIAAIYLYVASTKFFSANRSELLIKKYFKPLAAGVISGTVAELLFYISNKYIFPFDGRLSGIIYIIILLFIFLATYIISILNLNYINNKDKMLISKIILKVIPEKFLIKKDLHVNNKNQFYENELVSIFVVTHNRLGILSKCLSGMLPTLDGLNYELIIIDNASNDGTREYLNKLSALNNQVKVILNETNTGINAKSMGAALARGEFIIGVDDDVIMFPPEWVKQMVHAYKSIPQMGYLATDVFQDETTNGAKHSPEMYKQELYDNGKVVLEVGPTGGWCFMISKEVYETIGPLITFEKRIFYPEDGDYVNRIINKGFKYGILSGVKVYHATGEFHNKDYKKVFDDKHADFMKKLPVFYELNTRLKRVFSFNRLILKLKEHSSKESN